ncbi:MAG: hypothetical protein EU536_02860 [Promethearchaeota archaeon]|nr:MAG: hypothetical protein EU536_02860 [Candidatus Lokiarchaeota archaeon]
MLHTIYIIEKKSGRAIFSKSYAFSIDETLISGFLSALYGFAQAELEDKGVDNIDMYGNRFVYVDNRGLLYIGAADKEDSAAMLHEQMNGIADSFNEAFSIPEDGGFDKLNWDGNVTIYRPFEETLDMLVQQWEMAKKIAKSAYMMDLIDVYQNLLQALAEFPEFSQLGLATGESLDISRMAFEEGTADMMMLAQLDEDAIRENLNTILTNFVTMLKNSIDPTTYQHRLHEFVFPLLKTDWIRIKEAKVDDFLIHLVF